jgi:hypothetical protein
MRLFDLFPFFDELDVLEIRLNELAHMVDKFFICEAGETYGGTRREFVFEAARKQERFAKFDAQIEYLKLPSLRPGLQGVPSADIRAAGRLREAFQRNEMWAPFVRACNPGWDDIVSFGDCDEIPSADAILRYLKANDNVRFSPKPARFKQKSFYYNVNRMVDYGHEFASRARIGRVLDVHKAGSLYQFRMLGNKDESFQAIENGGWHFGYFGSLEKIKTKVAALSPFLNEYKLFSDATLREDIRAGRDLHHRRCELPEQFTVTPSDDSTLPAYFLANRERFKHFTAEGQLG